MSTNEGDLSASMWQAMQDSLRGKPVLPPWGEIAAGFEALLERDAATQKRLSELERRGRVRSLRGSVGYSNVEPACDALEVEDNDGQPHKVDPPRGSMPTRADLARAFLADWQTNGFNDYRLADAALSLLAPHVAALERERDENAESMKFWHEAAERTAENRDAARVRITALEATARQAEEENARLRERVKAVEEERDDTLGTLRTAALPAMSVPERASYCLGYTGTCAFCDWRSQERMRTTEEAQAASKAHMLACPAMRACLVPPPSASAGTGTISDEALGEDLLNTYLNAPDGDATFSFNAVARRAKELLGAASSGSAGEVRNAFYSFRDRTISIEEAMRISRGEAPQEGPAFSPRPTP